MIDARKLTDGASVSPFVQPDQLHDLVGRFRTVVNNRPDGEEPGQPTSSEIEAAAHACGLNYVHIPVIAGQIAASDVEAFGDALEREPGPALAFCRTGTRSAMLWALSEAGRRSVDEILETAKAAGYDLSGLTPRIQELATR